MTSSGDSNLLYQVPLDYSCTSGTLVLKLSLRIFSRCVSTLSKKNIFDMSEMESRSPLCIAEYKHTAFLAINMLLLTSVPHSNTNCTGLALVRVSMSWEFHHHKLLISLQQLLYTLQVSFCQNLTPEDLRTVIALVHCLSM